MTRRWQHVMVMIAGSFLLYCGQTAMNPDGGSGDGFVSDADAAGDCGCTTGPAFTKLAEGTLVKGATAPPIAVGSYREVVVYETSRTPASCIIYGNDLTHRFRPDANTPFGDTWQDNFGRIRVDGTDLQLAFATSDCTSIGYVVAGVH